MADQTEKTVRDLRAQLSSKAAHVSNIEQRNKDLAAEVASLRDQVRKGKSELEANKTQLDLLMCDKENLMVSCFRENNFLLSTDKLRTRHLRFFSRVARMKARTVLAKLKRRETD